MAQEMDQSDPGSARFGRPARAGAAYGPRAMTSARLQLGTTAEEIAAARLAAAGWRLVARRVRVNGVGLRGELDLIGVDGETLVFVEVKARSAGSTGWPGEPGARGRAPEAGEDPPARSRLATRARRRRPAPPRPPLRRHRSAPRHRRAGHGVRAHRGCVLGAVDQRVPVGRRAGVRAGAAVDDVDDVGVVGGEVVVVATPLDVADSPKMSMSMTSALGVPVACSMSREGVADRPRPWSRCSVSKRARSRWRPRALRS